MPTLLYFNGIRFFFYSNENNEPIHVHVTKGDATGKIWIEPVVHIAYWNGFTSREEKTIFQLVEQHQEDFKNKWYEYFKK